METLKELRKIEINGKKLKEKSYFVMERDLKNTLKYFEEDLCNWAFNLKNEDRSINDLITSHFGDYNK